MRYPYIILVAIICLVSMTKAKPATLLLPRGNVVQGFDALIQEEYKNKIDIRQSTNMHRFVPRQHDGSSEASATATENTSDHQASTSTSSSSSTESSSSSSSSSSSNESHGQDTGHKSAHRVYADNPALTTGALFYLGLAVSVVLWCTGYALDFVLDRDEKMVDKLLSTSIPEKV